jgi:hypothetical protein
MNMPFVLPFKMHALVNFFAVLLFSTNVQAMEIDKFTSGSWYNPAQKGHGLSVEVLDDGRTIAYWYTYSPTGHSLFLVGSGENQGSRVTLDTYGYDGMKFGEFDPDENTQYYWGTMTLDFHDCNSATLTYSSTFTYGDEEFGSGTIPLTKLASINGMQCSPEPVAGLYQGNFYSDILNQVIPGFVAVAPNGEFAAVSFDAMAGVGSWTTSGKNFSANGTAVSADPSFSFSSNLSISGQFSVGYRMVGNYTVSGGDRGTFDFFAVTELYRRGISLTEIAGTYNAENLVSGGTGKVTISQSGSLSGSDSFGCRYAGQLSPPDPQFNLIKIKVTVSSCGVSDGIYNGYGAQIDYYNLDDGRGIRLVATNGKYAGVIDMYR